jgi:hypothetical protein
MLNWVNGEVPRFHFEDLGKVERHEWPLFEGTHARYSSTWSVWAPQYTKISSTPALARNSSVYSISGTLASGSKHYASISSYSLRWQRRLTRGRSRVNGAKRFSKESVRTCWKVSPVQPRPRAALASVPMSSTYHRLQSILTLFLPGRLRLGSALGVFGRHLARRYMVLEADTKKPIRPGRNLQAEFKNRMVETGPTRVHIPRDSKLVHSSESRWCRLVWRSPQSFLQKASTPQK